MKLSVIILNYNVRYFLELCLKSVEAALTTIDSEIIVVDNKSTDDSCAMIKQGFPNVQLIENKENYGFSKGNNIGVKKALGRYICILNPDTVIAEDTFIKLLGIAEAKQDLGILGCRLIDGTGAYLPESKRNIPKPSIAIKKILGFDRSYYANHLKDKDNGKVEVLVGAFMLLKRDVYNELNGFDEDYFMYGEDIDLSYRVLKLGYQNYYVGSQSIIHFKGESTLKDKTYANRFYKAMSIFYEKHFKKNWFYDVMVAIGIKIIPMLKLDKVESSENDEIIIFNNNEQSFKSIIKAFEKETGNFKIRPKNSNFILGSHSSKSRGSVQQID